MTEQQMRDECAKIEKEWQMGGLTGGLYEDFAVTLANRAVAAERERCAVLCDSKYERHASNGFPREASTARVLAAEIRGA